LQVRGPGTRELDDFNPKREMVNHSQEVAGVQGLVLYNGAKSFETIGMSGRKKKIVQNLELQAGLIHPNGFPIDFICQHVKGNPFVLGGIIVPHDWPEDRAGFYLVEFFSVVGDIPYRNMGTIQRDVTFY
jgi:hypothetical protein